MALALVIIAAAGWYGGGGLLRCVMGPTLPKLMPPSQPPPTDGHTGLSWLAECLGVRSQAGSAQLEESIGRLAELRHMWLTDVDDDAAYALAEALQPGRARRLEMLRMGKDVYADGCAAIAEALGRGGAIGDALRDGAAPALENLWLGGNLIGDYGAEALAQAITPRVGFTARGLPTGCAHRLRRLGLYSNAIGDTGALALARAIEARHEFRHRLRAERTYDVEGGADGAEGVDGGLAVLTVMLFGHQVSDEATMQAILRVEDLGAQIGGDRIELFSPREEAQAGWSHTSSLNASRDPSNEPSRDASPARDASRRPSNAPSRHPSRPGSEPSSPKRVSSPGARGSWSSPVSANISAGHFDGSYEYLQLPRATAEGEAAPTGYEYHLPQPQQLPPPHTDPAYGGVSGPPSRERTGDPSFSRFGSGSEMY
ncbi:hypothetical protein Ctob_009499 [Chrysochromulina tobinii]|uniref:Uncharacterized protein n=1 Tax=Chrysochromulina tobinii TaxID=1460289 RepID=A0A0M0JB98_9EUKA|nr:hypothetical protein Ctob_009499 [Chrysochromulina tobinii]|eukprot:KOO23632.1 hypothetical protein Ctob_009499 [Chrysochromulina sp. CCMP291]